MQYDLELFTRLNDEYRSKPLVRRPPIYNRKSLTDRSTTRANSLKKYFGSLEGKRFLEIGCGRGETAYALSQRVGTEVIGVDIRSYQHWAEYGARVRFYNTDLSKSIPDDIGKFDCIYSFAVWEHVHHPFTMLKVAFDLLKEGGEIFLSANLYRGPKASHRYKEIFFPWPHLLFADEIFEKYYCSIGLKANRPAWVNRHSAADYRNYFGMVGFKELKITYAKTPIDEEFYARFSDVLSRFPRYDLERDFIQAHLQKPWAASIKWNSTKRTILSIRRRFLKVARALAGR